MSDAASGELSTCGCCEGVHDRVPARIANRPGLGEIGYRVGDYHQFKQSLLAGLTDGARQRLGGLLTRDDDDFAIGLIDAWAMVGDVLTFYVERTAQEHYLGTATERPSVAGLVHLIGYRPRPGVAASTALAFTLEASPLPPRQAPPGVPERVPIATRTRVQSIPGPDERPQTFETTEDIEAHVAWNRLLPQMTELRYPRDGSTDTYLAGSALNLAPGDMLLFVGKWTPDAPGDGWAARRVTRVEPDAQHNRTRVSWEPTLVGVADANSSAAVSVHVLRQRASLFGYNAPDPRLFVDTILTRFPHDLRCKPNTEIVACFDTGTSKPISGFPGNVVDWSFSSITDGNVLLDAIYQGLEPESWAVFVHPVAGRRLTRIDAVSDQSHQDFTIGTRVSRLSVQPESLTLFSGDRTRGTAILLGSEALTLAETPLDTPIAGDTIPVVVDVTIEPLTQPRKVVVRGRRDGAPLAADDEVIAEVAMVESVEPVPDKPIVTLTLAEPLANVYDRATVEIFGNVADASHGESIRGEVLGSGDAARPYQQFALDKGPLTYVSAPTPSGGASTLEVWVNDVRWDETPTFFDTSPRDRVYVTGATQTGETAVRFGDGFNGARPPTGFENIRANYRTGIGAAGNLGPDRLTLLMTRPLGVKAVNNPVPASGGQEQETAGDARTGAPLTVLTLERIVSLQDYEDFARGFAGVAKASAVDTWDGARRGVLLTVAGIDGAELAPGMDPYDNLIDAIADAGNRRLDVRVKTYRPRPFFVTAALLVEARHDPEIVLARARADLSEQFSFAARAFGQLVSLSEVTTALQNVSGVVAVDVNQLYKEGETALLNPYLTADAPQSGAPPDALAAELLTLAPESLAKVTVQP
jgi:hypothetical protein